VGIESAPGSRAAVAHDEGKVGMAFMEWERRVHRQERSARPLHPTGALAMLAVTTLAAALWGAGCGADDTGAAARCGDGRIDGAEACDDGNTEAGDGCTPACNVERGWLCDGEPSVCERVGGPRCGDGVIQSTEDCDDGNARPGDGCGPTCRVEGGWTCTGEPSSCTELPDAGPPPDPDAGPGDGDVPPADADSGTAPGPGDVVEPICGDGLAQGGETCDDGNTDPDDGCDATCATEEGWVCGGEPSTCTEVGTGDPVCGDGALQAGEACDDGNNREGDGCDATCAIESGWRCAGSPGECWIPCAVPNDCARLNNECGVGTCDNRTARCRVVAVVDGRPCAADGVCTDGGVCGAGVCIPRPRDCSSLDTGCTVGVCDEATDACVPRTLEEGEVCGPAGECANRVCRAGTCAVENLPPCTTCAGGASFCGGGQCGGVRVERVDDFAGGVLPAGYAMSGTLPWVVAADSTASNGWALRSGAIGGNGTTSATLTVTVSEPTDLTFRFRMGSESCCDFFQFSINGRLEQQFSGAIAWREVTFPLPAGTHSLRFTYTKDGTISTSPDAVFLDRLRVGGQTPACVQECGTGVWDGTACVTCNPAPAGTTCTPEDTLCQTGACQEGTCVFTDVADNTACGATDACTGLYCIGGACTQVDSPPCTACGDGDVCAAGVCGGLRPTRPEDFEGASLPPEFQTAGSQPWRIDTTQFFDGRSSARAGAIGHSATSIMRTTVRLQQPGEIRFRYRVSSEACCDRFRFLLNGNELVNAAGEAGWTLARFPVPAGFYRLEWSYTKDSSTVRGSDTAWVDALEIDGVGPSCEQGCGTGVFDGDVCLTCDPVDDGQPCVDDGNPCTAGLCADGTCSRLPVPDCTPCDGAAGPDLCVSGRCGGLPAVVVYGPDIALEDAGFTTSGNVGWRFDEGVTLTGLPGAVSGAIGNRQQSILQLVVDVDTPSTVSFAVEVGSELNFDVGEFTIDGVVQGRWSGPATWRNVSYPLNPGRRVLRWRYEKDASTAVVPDRMRIANVRIEQTRPCTSDACALSRWDGFACTSCPVADPACE
jgi:cysteine-rich repeat protein